jgi:hypothetical protein
MEAFFRTAKGFSFEFIAAEKTAPGSIPVAELERTVA